LNVILCSVTWRLLGYVPQQLKITSPVAGTSVSYWM
jgi:hypothetical protein